MRKGFRIPDPGCRVGIGGEVGMAGHASQGAVSGLIEPFGGDKQGPHLPGGFPHCKRGIIVADQAFRGTMHGGEQAQA